MANVGSETPMFGVASPENKETVTRALHFQTELPMKKELQVLQCFPKLL